MRVPRIRHLPAESAIDDLEAFARLRSEVSRSRRSDAIDTGDVLLKEEAGIRARGRVYDRRLLEFDVEAALAATQTDVYRDGGGFDQGYLPSYGVLVRVLKSHPYPITLHAHRTEDRTVTQGLEFSSALTTLAEDWGANLDLNAGRLRGSLTFLHTNTESESPVYSRTETRDGFDAVFRHNSSGRIRTELKAGYEQVESGPIPQAYETTTLTFSSVADLGHLDKRPRAVLSTTVNFWDRTGFAAQSNLRASESLLWRLTPDLDSRFVYSFARLRSSGLETKQNTFSQSFVHRLYESLTTTAEGFYNRDSIGPGVFRRGGGKLNLAYRKKIPKGLLAIDYAFDFTWEDRNPRSGGGFVQDEIHTLSSTRIVLLDEPEIVPGSVVVTRASDRTVMLEGIDYRLVPRGGRLELVRIPGGGIPEGSLVFVAYEFVNAADVAFDTLRQAVSVQVQLFRALQLYARYDDRDQELTRGLDASILEDITDRVLGAEVNWRGFRIAAEYFDHDADFSPYRQLRGEVAYSSNVRNWLTWGIGLSRLLVTFPEGDDLRVSAVTGSLRLRPMPKLRISVDSSFRDETGRGANDRTFDVKVDGRYTFGELIFKLEARFETADYTLRETSDTFVAFTIERRW